METQITTLPLIPFSLLFAQTTTPTCEGEQTVGAATETETSLDNIVKTDSVEDEDIES